MKKASLLLLALVLAMSVGFSSGVIKMTGAIDDSNSVNFAPVPSPDGGVIYFTSDRTSGMGGQDIWVSHLVNGIWSEPVDLPLPLNGPGNEGADSFSYDKQNLYMFLTLCNQSDGMGGCDLYLSVYSPDGTWTEPANIGPEINTQYQEANAFFDSRNKILYFISNRPGGFGTGTQQGQLTYDFWYSFQMPDGKWDEPRNLGAPINTPENEHKIYYDPATGWFFFSSKGHEGKGGADIFRVKLITPEQWGEVTPVGVVNSERNDSYFSLAEGGDYAFFNSDVEGKDKIYMVPVKEIFSPEEISLREQYYQDNCPPAMPAVGELAKALKMKPCGLVEQTEVESALNSSAITASLPAATPPETKESAVAPSAPAVAEEEAATIPSATATPVADEPSVTPPAAVTAPTVVSDAPSATPEPDATIPSAITAGEPSEPSVTQPAVETTTDDEPAVPADVPAAATPPAVITAAPAPNQESAVAPPSAPDIPAPAAQPVDKTAPVVATASRPAAPAKASESAVKQQFEMSNNIYFGLDKGGVKPSSEMTLMLWADYLKQNPQRKVELSGHADSLGRAEYNLLLSKRRVDSVAAWLVRAGVRREQIMPAYYGSTRPAEPNDPVKGNPRNRRVEFKVMN